MVLSSQPTYDPTCRSLRKGPDVVSPAVATAVAARQAAVDLCQRCALDAASDLKAEDLWFPLLQVSETVSALWQSS